MGCLLATPSAASARVSLGVNAGPHASLTTLQAIVAAKGRHVRQKFSWAETEPQRGSFDWSRSDVDFEASSRAGIEIIPVLSDTPAWAIRAGTPLGRVDTYPTAMSDFANWAGAVARRYGRGGSFWASRPDLAPRPVLTWQVWNEPNVPVFWTGGKVDPARYAWLLVATRSAILAADSRAAFLSAGVAAGNDPGSMHPEDFMRATWKVLGTTRSRWFSWAAHAYSTTAAYGAAIIPRVRALMDRYGCRGCLIKVTEFGWSSGVRQNGWNGWLCAGSQVNQARMADDFLKRVLPAAAKNRLTSLSWYRWDESADAPPLCFNEQGLVNPDGSAKPVLSIFTRNSR